MNTDEFTQKFAKGIGFIAAMDQSGASSPKTLRTYGVGDDEWAGDEEMFEQIHAMRARVLASPSFASGKVIGAILFEKTMDGDVDGKPAPDALRKKGIAPFLKVDQGLADEADDVQLMKPLDRLDALLEKAVAKGMYGTKMRSNIKGANPAGIAAVIEQQFAAANRIVDAGLMPIIEPEFDITAKDREAGEDILKAEILKNLDAHGDDRRVILKLSLPVKAGLYDELVGHPKVLSLVALSGGFSTQKACDELAQNKGMIASFSRATLQELRVSQSDAEFDAALGAAIDAIHAASVA